MSWSIWLVPSSVWVGAVLSKYGLKWLQECAFTCCRRPISPLWFLRNSAIGCNKWGKLAPFIFFLFLQELITHFYFFFTGMSWKLHSRFHGQIDLATQFTNGVIFKWHFQNFPLEAGFLVVRGKKNETPPPIPRITTELEVRELSQSDFWDISSHPTSVLSFSQISWS